MPCHAMPGIERIEILKIWGQICGLIETSMVLRFCLDLVPQKKEGKKKGKKRRKKITSSSSSCRLRVIKRRNNLFLSTTSTSTVGSCHTR